MQDKIDLPNLHPVTPKLRAAVLTAWNHRCAYCETGTAAHVDHIWPRAKGGADHLENYAAACERCNLAKSDLPLARGFLEIISAKAVRKAPRIAKSLERARKSPRVAQSVKRARKPRPARSPAAKRTVQANLTCISLHIPLHLAPPILELEKMVQTHEITVFRRGKSPYQDYLRSLKLPDDLAPDIVACLRDNRSTFRTGKSGGLLYYDAGRIGAAPYAEIHFSDSFDFFAVLRLALRLGHTEFSFSGTILPQSPQECQIQSTTCAA